MSSKKKYAPRKQTMRKCRVCGTEFSATRSDADLCGATCRQVVSRIGRGQFGSSVALLSGEKNANRPYKHSAERQLVVTQNRERDKDKQTQPTLLRSKQHDPDQTAKHIKSVTTPALSQESGKPKKRTSKSVTPSKSKKKTVTKPKTIRKGAK